MNESKFSTTDLYFASYLKAMSFQLIEIQRIGIKTIFVFNINDFNSDSLKQDYLNRKSAVSAVMFADAIRSLKTLCHVNEENGKIITQDLYFATYLKVKKCVIENIKHKDFKTIFTFNPEMSNLSISELKLGYFNNVPDESFNVNASDYIDVMRSLKTMCHIALD